MEPDHIPVHDLLGVGDKPDPGPDELRAIVSRAGRRRWAMAGIAATLALGLGLGIGFAASGQSAPSASQTATAGPASPQNATGGATPSAGAGSGSAGASSGSPSTSFSQSVSPDHLTRLFTRTAGATTVRGFLVTVPQIAGLPAGCQVGGSSLQVEVSTARMVGSVLGGLGGFDRSQPASGVSSQVVGTAEGNPTAVVTAATGAGVAKVSMSFAGGATDAMAPVEGWVALAAPVSSSLGYGSSLGTLTERDSAGKVLGTQTVQMGVESSPAVSGSSCSVMCPGVQPQSASGRTSSAANSASAAIARACSPLPCSSLPRVTVPSNQGTTGSTPVEPGGVISSPATGGSAYACVQPAGPARAGSGSTGVSP